MYDNESKLENTVISTKIHVAGRLVIPVHLMIDESFCIHRQLLRSSRSR